MGIAGTSGATGTTGAVGSGGSTTGAAGSIGAGGGSATSGGGASGGAAESSGGTGGTGAAGAGGTGGGATTSAGCGTPAGLTSGRASIDVGGTMREYILELPDDYDPGQPYKLIFVWHPLGGSADQTAGGGGGGYMGLLAVSGGQAIFVAPHGTDYQDRGLGWGNENGKDIDFLHAMLDRFTSGLCIDQERIFSTGFSFGGMFSFTLACSQGSMMRAIAPEAGNPMTAGCEDGTRSVATMGFVGTDDGLLEPHRDGIQILVERNGCSTQPVTMQPSWCDGIDAEFEPCTCVEYPDCKAGYPVIACEYKAGHQFAPNAADTIWNFFSQF
jgi:poly(3-hydroxybutyrate) depolymerase